MKNPRNPQKNTMKNPSTKKKGFHGTRTTKKKVSGEHRKSSFKYSIFMWIFSTLDGHHIQLEF